MSDEAASSYPAKIIADLLMVSARHLAQLAEEGHVPKPIANRYDLVGCVQGYIKFKSKADGESIAAEKLRKTKLEADALQRAKEIDEGDLIPAPLAISLVNEHFAAVRSEFEKDYQLTIPSLCEGKNSGAIRKICDKLFADRCRNLSTRKAKCLPDSAAE